MTGEHAMSLDSYRGLLSDFGGAIGLAGLAPDEEGYCALTFDDLPVHLQYDPEKDEIVAFSRIGTADEDRLEEIYGMLLGANLFWQGARGATLSVEPYTSTVFIADRRPAGLPDAAFQEWLGEFVEIAEHWRGRLARVNAGGPIDEADETPDPHGDTPGGDYMVRA
jgi:Tir chaperone protein (CesT) family